VDKILKFLNDNKDVLGWLFGSGILLVVLGGIYRLIVWLLKEYRLRRIRTNENFPFKIIPPNSNVTKEILGGADDDPLADRNIPYQQRIQGRNTRRDLEELIEDNRCILIAGRTGLGKTREAVQLAQSLNNEGWTVLYLTREAWLDAPAKLPNNVPERKLLFFLDDLNKKCLSSKAEIRPNASESLTLPIYEPFQIRLKRTLEAFDTFCGKSEIRIIGTARNEKTSDFDEPSEWGKLAWTKYNDLWEKFKIVELPEPDKTAEQKLLVETAAQADISIELGHIQTIAKRNDGTFRNLVENLSSSRTEGSVLSTENFRDTLKGTWRKRYLKAIQKFPEATHIYDAMELIQLTGINLRHRNVISVASILYPAKGIEKLKFGSKVHFILKYLEKTENILDPRDGQIEAKGHKISIEDHVKKLYIQIYRKHYSESLSLFWKITYFVLLTPKKYFLEKELSPSMIILNNFILASSDLNNVGNAYLDLGLAKEALFFYERSIKLKETEFWRFFSKKRLASGWVNKGKVYVSMKQYDNAISAFEKAVEFNRKSYFAWRYLGDVYEEIRDYDNAINMFNKAIEVRPKAAFPWFSLGYIYLRLKKYDEAIKAYEKATKLDRKWAAPWNGLGHVYIELLRFDEAISAYQKAIALEPKWTVPWNNLGSLYSDLQQVEDAIAACQKAIAISPNSAKLWINLASVYVDSRRFGEAQSACEKAIELDPKDAISWNHLGIVYRDINLADNAINALKKSIELDPEYSFAWYSLGNLYHLAGDIEKSLPYYEKALELSPDEGAYRTTLIVVLRKLGRDVDAVEQQKITCTLMENENEYNRACFEAACGNKGEAIRLLKIALEQKQVTRHWAQQDPDLDFIRNDSLFKELVGLE